MKSMLLRGLAALALLAAPCAHALVVQQFSTTHNYSGPYAPFPLGGSAAWSAAQSTAPLASVTYDLTIAGSFTILEGNPWPFLLAWTPTLGLSFAPSAPGVSGPPVQYDVTGPTQTLPGQSTANVVYFQPVTLSFSQQFSFTLTGSTLAAYQGSGSVWLGDTSSFWPLAQFGGYSGSVTHTGELTYVPVPEQGGTLGLLALGLVGLSVGVHRRRRVRSGAGL